jgi:cytochrome c-type biogenesis protein CcmH/NrfG
MNFLSVRGPGCSVGIAALLALSALGGCAGSAATGAHTPRTPLDAAAEIAEAQSILATRPDDTEAWFRLGLGWQLRSEAETPPQSTAFQDSALVAFEAVLARDPNNVKAIVHRGLVLEDLNRQAEALLAYQKATELAPTDPLPYINLGSLLYFQYHKTYEAKQALTKALSLDPDNADAHFNLGVLFADANLFHEAAVEWNRVIEIEPDAPASQLARDNLERIQPILDVERGEDASDGE